ncbi:MAG: cyclase family protein [bacterium]
MDTSSTIIDLTHTISSKTPTFDGGCGFYLSTTVDYHECTEPNLFRVQKIDMRAGIGTHIDAPAHCIEGGETIESLKLENLVTACVMIAVDTGGEETFRILPEIVEAFEKTHGQIASNSFVIFYTGWDKYWDTAEKYLNDHKSPSIDVRTAELLLARNVSGIGIDTLSADSGAEDFPVHRAVLGAGKYLVENIANASKLPSVGAQSIVLPMKIQDATESPVRLIALVPSKI